MKKKIGNFELVDHGIDGSQYFQGCGVSFTEFQHCATGCGDNPAEAFEDLMDMVAQYGYSNGQPNEIIVDGVSRVNNDAWDTFDTTGLERRILKSVELKKFPSKPSAYQEMIKANGYGDFDESQFDETEPDRNDYESDDAFDQAYEVWQNEIEAAEEKWDSEKEAFSESMECDNYYYMSLRWCEK